MFQANKSIQTINQTLYQTLMNWIEAGKSPVGIFCNVSKLSSVSIINFFLINWLGKNCINVLLSFFQIENNTITYQTYKQIVANI